MVLDRSFLEFSSANTTMSRTSVEFQFQPLDFKREHLSPVYEETSGYTTEGTIGTSSSGGSLPLPHEMYRGNKTKSVGMRERANSSCGKVSAFSSLGELKSLVQKREKVHLKRVSMGNDDMELLAGTSTIDEDEKFEEAFFHRKSFDADEGDEDQKSRENIVSKVQNDTVKEGDNSENSDLLSLGGKEMLMQASKQSSQRMKRAFTQIKKISVKKAARKMWKKLKPLIIGKKRVHKNRGVKFEKGSGYLT